MRVMVVMGSSSSSTRSATGRQPLLSVRAYQPCTERMPRVPSGRMYSLGTHEKADMWQRVQGSAFGWRVGQWAGPAQRMRDEGDEGHMGPPRCPGRCTHKFSQGMPLAEKGKQELASLHPPITLTVRCGAVHAATTRCSCSCAGQQPLVKHAVGLPICASAATAGAAGAAAAGLLRSWPGCRRDQWGKTDLSSLSTTKSSSKFLRGFTPGAGAPATPVAPLLWMSRAKGALSDA